MPDIALVERAGRGDRAALRELIDLLFNEDYYVAEWAAEHMGWVGNRARAPLIRVLTDRNADAGARILAAEGLVNVGGREAVDAMLDVLGSADDDIEVRRAVATYIAHDHDLRICSALSDIALGDDNDRQLRACAILGLSSHLDRRAIPVLQELVEGSDARLARLASHALVELGPHLGMPGPDSVPRRFRSPVPHLPRPPGAKRLEWQGGGGARRGSTDAVTLQTGLDPAALTEHYGGYLKARGWKLEGTTTSPGSVQTRWRLRSKWFLDCRAELTVERASGREDVYRVKFRTWWQPARWYNARWIIPPFQEDDDTE